MRQRAEFLTRCIRISLCILFINFLNAPSSFAAPTWTLIYQTTNSARDGSDVFQYSAGYGKTGGAADTFIASGQNWDVIKIRMDATTGGTTYSTEVYFDKWAGATIAGLQLPDHANQSVISKNVTNLVVTSNYTGAGKVKTGSFALGRLEMWPYNYSPALSGLSPPGNASTFDWDDTISVVTNGHGSYQIHNLTDTQTIIAWNMHRSGGPAEIGMGNSTGSHPDWTSGGGTWTNTNFLIQVSVGISTTSGTIGNPTGSGNFSKGKALTLTAVTNGPGKVTFYTRGKRIPGCVGVQVVDYSGLLKAICTMKPDTSGALKVNASYTSNTSAYTNASSGVSEFAIGRRSGAR
ncbi:MAG: hypothetical protein F2519_04375 [Actinobacteria bacterium]|uniref:Unannotated protein n=1 Tax=freshwater metagenome TaxID=449393 RepID=A0A6J6BGG9_9ZZZZ|nr:hypothetical protein [Actinomycetota bacterium]